MMAGGKKDSFSTRMVPCTGSFAASRRNQVIFSRLKIKRKDLVKGVIRQALRLIDQTSSILRKVSLTASFADQGKLSGSA